MRSKYDLTLLMTIQLRTYDILFRCSGRQFKHVNDTEKKCQRTEAQKNKQKKKRNVWVKLYFIENKNETERNETKHFLCIYFESIVQIRFEIHSQIPYVLSCFRIRSPHFYSKSKFQENFWWVSTAIHFCPFAFVRSYNKCETAIIHSSFKPFPLHFQCIEHVWETFQ